MYYFLILFVCLYTCSFYIVCFMLIKDQVIPFTVIHRIFCHMSIYVPYSNHVNVHVTFVKSPQIWMGNGF